MHSLIFISTHVGAKGAYGKESPKRAEKGAPQAIHPDGLLGFSGYAAKPIQRALIEVSWLGEWQVLRSNKGIIDDFVLLC